MGARQLCAMTFAERHPDEAARLIERFPAEEAGPFLARVPAPVGAALLARMSVAAAGAHLGAMGAPAASAALAALPGAVAASVLRRQAPDARAALLEGLPRETRRALERRLDYPEGTAGWLADSDVPALAEHLTATEARRAMRQSWPAAHRYVYVTDDSHQLTGVIRARDLAATRARATLASIMKADVMSLSANADLAAVVEHPAWRDFDPLPVTDRAGVFVGAIRHQKLRELSATGAGGSLTETLLRLGELYWVGLSTMFPAVGADLEGGGATEKEVDHGA